MSKCAEYGWAFVLEPKYVIDAGIEYDFVEEHAAGRVKQFPGGGYDDEMLNDYNEMIANVVNIIEVNGFDIVGEGQTSDSYSYYINFVPKDGNGTPLDVVQIRFRVSDHPLRHGRDNINTKVRTIFKSFWFGGDKYPDVVSLQDGVDAACKAIKGGDFSKLTRL